MMNLIDKGLEFGLGCGLALIAARKGQIIIKHILHFGYVRIQFFNFRPFRQHGQLQFQARQRRAQIMAHPGQHGGALLNLALNTVSHFDERSRSTAHFRCTGRAEIRHISSFAELLSRFGKALNRTNLIA
ncbi:MAG: Uncharacterised protein [Alphaproteobacteria bacterium]|nr:MAG: Uncharacterised protein [Alphaproteobacteria bacterium]